MKFFLLGAVLATAGAAMAQSTVPEYINTGANKIELPSGANRDAWRKLAHDMDALKSHGGHIDIMHIGDSHIQAEMGTSQVRKRMQERYGNAGRGLITAFRLAGTNQPVDYFIVSENPTDSQCRLLKRPWPITPGFTGVASSSQWSNKITFGNKEQGHDFDRARIYTSLGTLPLSWNAPVDSAAFRAFAGERVYGMYTYNSTAPGIVYSTIGNNGACYSDYLLIDGFEDAVASFSPRLIVVSMGANEAYSGKTPEQIESATRQLLSNLRKANPESLFLVWLPMESHLKDDNGNYSIHQGVPVARDIINKVARENGAAIWNFYDVAGGEGVAQRWVDDGLMNPRDHIHLLRAGYQLQGDLAADALIAFLDSL